MAFKIADAFVEVTARTSSIASHVKNAVGRLGSDAAPEAEKSGNAIGKKFMSGFLSNIRSPSSLKTFIATFAGITSVALTSVPALVEAGKWIGELAKSAGAASPALAGMGVVGAAAFATLKLGFSDFGTALKQGDTPAQIKKINKALADLHPEARATAYAVRDMHPEFEKIKRSVQGEIFKGLADNVKAVGEQLLAKATPGMVRFGGAVNLVIQDLLSWTGSLAGVRATEQITNSMYIGMSRLHPSITRVTSSFGNMIGRIAEVSTAAGVSGLGGVMDWLAEKMDRVNAATVSNGLAELNTKYHQVKDAISATVDWVRQAIDFWRTYRTEIGYVQDALAVLAIAFGGPVIAVGAAVLMIIRHWDEFKAAWQGVVDYFNSTPGTAFMNDMRATVETLVAAWKEHWQAIRDATSPVLDEIFNKLKNDVIPTFGEFLRALVPVQEFFINVLGPVIGEEMRGIFEVISGVLDIISGTFKVFIGVLTFDWSTCWEGIKQITSGAWQILREIFLAMGGQLVIDMFNKGMQLWRDFTGWIGRLRDDAGNFANDMRNRVLNTIGSLVGAAVGKAAELWSGFTGQIGRLRDNTIGFVDDMRNRVVGALNSLGDGFWRTVDHIGHGWNRLREIVATPIRAVFDVWNRANDLWGGADLHFATGGPVPGVGTGDTVPAMLTPGEFVIRKGIAQPTMRFLQALNAGQAEAVQAAGGQFGRMQKFAEGGPVQRGQEWARAQHGKPYIWGGVGPRGFDCSGFMSAITNVLLGRNPHSRIGATASMPWPGFRAGLNSAFGLGWFTGNPGHTAGTLGGANVESGGSPSMTKYIQNAAGATHRQFNRHMSLPMAGGEFIGGGGGGGMISLKPAVKKIIHDFMNPLINRLPGEPPMMMGMPRGMATKARDFLTDKAMSLVPFDSGGMLQPGMQYVRNDTRQPERVLSPDQTMAFERLVDWLDSQQGGSPGLSGRPINLQVTQTSGSPAETGRFVALALRSVG